MYCPSCRSEYIEGVKMCKECDVALVEEMPPEPRLEYQEQAGVFSSTSPSLVAMAQSILESAGIESFIKDASLANLLDMNIVELQVAVENEEDARKLLEDLKVSDESEEPAGEEEGDQDEVGEEEEEYGEEDEEEIEDEEEVEEVEEEVVVEETVTETGAESVQGAPDPGAEEKPGGEEKKE